MNKPNALTHGRDAANTSSSRLVQETPDILPLHTNAAAFLFNGRRRAPAANGLPAVPGIMGARRFFSLVGKMEIGCKRDDPFADWYFHRVDRAIVKGRQRLHDFAESLAELNPPTRVEKGQTRPKKPHRVEYSRPGVLGYQLMALLEQVDDQLLEVIILGHRGVITLEKKTKLLASLEKDFRRILHASVGYTFTGVTRADFATRNVEAGYEGSPVLVRAIELMGECPVDYVNRDAVSKYAPRPVKERGKLLQLVADTGAPDVVATSSDDDVTMVDMTPDAKGSDSSDTHDRV